MNTVTVPQTILVMKELEVAGVTGTIKEINVLLGMAELKLS